jgi:hypothetical protein
LQKRGDNVNFSELLVGAMLVLALLGLAGYFAWRQFKVRYALVQDRALPPDERAFLIRQTRRRLICSVLMVLFAGFLIGWYFIEPNFRDLEPPAGHEPGKAPPLVELLALYWITALVVLFGILVLAGMDFFATARYAMRQKKLLQAERRAALETEVARLRQQRNGS